MSLSKMMIGTAQFGMDYGIANVGGRVSQAEIGRILGFAKEHRVHKLDTASVYGDSEIVLGELADPVFDYVTKLPAMTGKESSVDSYIHEFFSNSLKKLRRDHCYGLLMHHADDLLGKQGPAIYEALQYLKANRKVKKIGVSVYSPEQVERLCARYDIDIIQFPLNLLDQRFIQGNFLADLKKKKIELHARSIFLQGLLMMPLEKLPAFFDKIKTGLQSFHSFCRGKNRSTRQGLIDFITSISEVDHYIVGIDNYQQIVDIVQEEKSAQRINPQDFHQYACEETLIINPSLWKLT